MYDKAKFLRYIKTDMFLAHTWANYKATMPKNQLDTMLKAMFNSYVLDNSVALREYEAA
jgi:hypothetical protein